ncbi:MAG: hypothetical protein SFY81_05790 [Verrucomicrobiota bacterium]|nr:hypothetical protein [Verrucomicrobiota bacterium]
MAGLFRETPLNPRLRSTFPFYLLGNGLGWDIPFSKNNFRTDQGFKFFNDFGDLDRIGFHFKQLKAGKVASASGKET